MKKKIMIYPSLQCFYNLRFKTISKATLKSMYKDMHAHLRSTRALLHTVLCQRFPCLHELRAHSRCLCLHTCLDALTFELRAHNRCFYLYTCLNALTFELRAHSRCLGLYTCLDPLTFKLRTLTTLFIYIYFQ